MTTDRYVLLGLAHVRSPWFTEVARWSTSGSLPIEFVKCISVEELRVRVTSGRVFSAALLDGRLASVDRDVLALLRDHQIPAVVVCGPADRRDWLGLGATATVDEPLRSEDLVDALTADAAPVAAVAAEPGQAPAAVIGRRVRGRLVAVTGAPGSGRSTLTAALAQGLAREVDVLLADLARRAHQAVLHDARDIVPGIQEMAEAHRSGRMRLEDVSRLTFDVPTRGYRLLLGLRRPSDWVSVRTAAFALALDTLVHATDVVVADCDAELEGEAETGSYDVQDRHQMTRTAIASCDLALVVATPTTSGLHSLVGDLEQLRSHGHPGGRTLVVLNRAPRGGRARAELTRVVASLTGARQLSEPHLGPVFVPERRNVDLLHHDLHPFPAAIVDPLRRAVADLLDRSPVRGPAPVDEHFEGEGVLIEPGSLSRWNPDDEIAL